MGNTESDLNKNKELSQADKERILQQNMLQQERIKNQILQGKIDHLQRNMDEHRREQQMVPKSFNPLLTNPEVQREFLKNKNMQRQLLEMAKKQKEQYINALKSDIKKDSSIYSKLLKGDEFLIKGDSQEFESTQKEDTVSGIYVTTQQFSNIALPIVKSDVIDNMLTKTSQTQIKSGLQVFKGELKKLKAPTADLVLNFIREKGYSEKFVNIIDLSLNCDGPVFIFSNWLQFGVEALSIILDACGFKKFPEAPGKSGLRYFVWSSETSSDKELIRKAKSTFNSIDNKDGSLIKIILGTRSIMEGVSFKNVKQVHITDPW